MNDRFKIKIDSVNGKVQYQVQHRISCCWMVVASFNTRKEAKKFIERYREG